MTDDVASLRELADSLGLVLTTYDNTRGYDFKDETGVRLSTLGRCGPFTTATGRDYLESGAWATELQRHREVLDMAAGRGLHLWPANHGHRWEARDDDGVVKFDGKTGHRQLHTLLVAADG